MGIDPINRAESNRQGGGEVATRQSQTAYIDYRCVDPHIFIQEAYDGKGGFSGRTDIGFYSYLIANASENFYKTRNSMSIYLNYFKKFIDAQWKPIFKQTIKTYVQSENGSPIEDHLYLDFCENVTGSGVSKIDFQKVITKSAFIHDVAFAIMDMGAEEIQPFIYSKTAYEVVDYTTDSKGSLTSITFDDGYYDGMYHRRYIGLDKFQILKSESNSDTDFVVYSESENTLGVLPVYPFWAQRPDDPACYKPFPSKYDIAGIGAYLYDKGSKLDYVIDKQAHAILAIQGNIDSVPNGVDNALVIGESQSSIFQPQYISPDTGLPAVHKDRISIVTAEMYDLMSDSGVSVQTSQIGTESGIAKSYTFNSTNTNLKATVTLQKGFDVWLQDMYKLFTGDTSDWSSWSEYPTDFTPIPRLTFEQIVSLIDFYGVEGLPKNQIDAHKQLRMLVDPMATVEDEQDLVDEIETRYNTLE